MAKGLSLFLVAFGIFITTSVVKAQVGQGQDGQTVYQNRCATCHGANGIATLPSAPNLLGQKKDYTLLQLRDFKSGQRKGTMMQAMIADLSDEVLVAVSDYISTGVCKP